MGSLCLSHWIGEFGEEASVSKVWDGRFEVIGMFPIPIISPNDVEFFKTTLLKDPHDRAVGQGTVRRRIQRDCVAFIPIHKTGDVKLAELGAAEFRRLAEKAGQMLPKSIRDVLPWHFEPSDFAGRWLSAMFWHNPPEASRILSYNRPRDGYTDFDFNPFSESADVIEDFGLLTGSPQFRTSDGKWPAWAGFLPDAAASNGIATKFSAPQSASDQETDSDGQILSSNQVEDAPKGISLLDVALLLNESDLDAARETRRRWYNSKAPKLPEGIGKDCEDSRARQNCIHCLQYWSL
jgi:hypothetical protein